MSNELNLNNNDVNNQIVELYNSGISIKSITKIVHKSYSNVSKILKDNNIKVVDR